MKRLFALLALVLSAPAWATDPQFGAIRVEATQNVVHAFVSAQPDSANAAIVSSSEWNAAHTAPAVVLLTIPTGIVWPAQPAAVTEFCGATTYRFRANLTNYTSISLSAQVISAGAATSALRLQYTLDLTGAAGWDYLDAASGPSVATSASGVALSATVSITAAAKADVLLRLVGINGDGAGAACYSTLKAATSTLADASTSLAANGANCSAGNYPLGVNASGAVEDCTAATAFTAEVASTVTYCADAGASDAYACNLTPAPASYAAIIGVPLTFKANTVNTGAATISFNSLGAQAIVKVGATTTTALVTNDIRAGALVTVQWDGTNFQCLSCTGNYANLDVANTWALGQTYSAAITVPNGAAATPSVHGSATDTGLYFVGSEARLVSGGTSRVEANSIGLKVIGTTYTSASTESLGLTNFRYAQLYLDATVTGAGTTGNQTINKNLGTVNFAAAATAITVTNSRVSATSLIFTTIRTADTTCTFVKSVVPGSGSFVITLNAACASETSVAFLVMN